MNKIFAMCCICKAFNPVDSNKCLGTLHANCQELKQGNYPCVVEKVLLGRKAPTIHSEPATYGLGTPFKHKGKIARADCSEDMVLVVLTDGTEFKIRKTHQLASEYEGKTLAEVR